MSKTFLTFGYQWIHPILKWDDIYVKALKKDNDRDSVWMKSVGGHNRNKSPQQSFLIYYSVIYEHWVNILVFISVNNNYWNGIKT